MTFSRFLIGTFFTAVAAGSPTAEAQVHQDRYIETPLLDLGAPSALSSPRVAATNGSVPPSFLRFIEGRDTSPRQLTKDEIARELSDPFGRLLANAPAPLPGTLTEVLKLIEAPESATAELRDQTVYIVSSTGQITLSEAPDLIRRPRGIVLRRDDQARQAVFIAPSFRETSTLEVMGWDENKDVFNYYERRFAGQGDDNPIWLWKGDSSQAWDAQTRDQACFRCHRNGEVNMKELRLPWQNWHSQSATIKPDSIPDDSPLKTSPVFAISSSNPFLRGGDEFERVINHWISRSNATKIAKFEAGALDVSVVLEPFFKTTTATLTSSIEQSAPLVGPPIAVPVSMFIDNRGLIDVGEVICTSMTGLSEQVTIPRQKYRDALAALNFRMEDPGNFLKSPGDTHFALLTSEVPRVDFDLMQQLAGRGLLSKKTAANLMLIDLVNPVYSPVREGIWEKIRPDLQDIGNAPLDAEIVAVFEKLLPTLEGGPIKDALAGYLDRSSLTAPEFEAEACRIVDAYLSGVTTEFESGRFQQYMQLIASRHDAFRNSGHRHLIETELLLPKTGPFSGLTMRSDGTVGRSPLADNQ